MGQPAQYATLASPAVIGIILEALDMPMDSWVPLVANEYNSTQATETYAGAGAVSPMREWIGEKQFKSVNLGSLTVSNKDWESTLRLFRKDLNRDKTGQLRQKAAELAIRGMQHNEKLLSALIDTGDDADIGTAFDGQYFFDTDHSFGSSGTINNDIAVDISALPCGEHGSTTAPSAGEMSLSILAAVQAIYGFKDDQGEPKNQSAKRFSVMVPTSLWTAAVAATGLNLLAGNEQNLIVANKQFSIDVIHNPRLTWTAAFAVFRTDGPTKACLVQTEEAPRIEYLAEGSDYAFHNAAHLYSVIKSGNVSYQDFTQACLVTMT